MHSIRIKNLRSLKDTEKMVIKPINILVGGNSSGKSTFLRLFPLMKQSFSKRINGPILWAGDEEDYVDFGSFKEALCTNSDSKNIVFEFSIEKGDGMCWLPFGNYIDFGNASIEIALEKYDENDFDYVSMVKMLVWGNEVILKISQEKSIDSVVINNSIYQVTLVELEEVPFFFGEKVAFDVPMMGLMETARRKLQELLGIESEDFSSMVDYLYSKNILKEKSKSKERERIFEGIVKKYERCNQDLSKEELDYLIMYNIPRIYGNIVNYIADYFRNVYYIAPVRATAERYYRLRNIAVNEVDCRGKNLAIFLNSLSDNQLKAFQEWTNKHLGFCVEKTLSEGHVSLKIRKKGSKEQINLSDTGFGYSQILPIVTQLWYIVVNERNYISYRNKVPVTIAIEQPELHLHPALQAKLVDVIVQVMKDTQTKKRRSVQFVLETHSETIINRFSTLIYKDKIKSDEIGISIFDRDTETMNTKIQHGIFDNEGYLENWPIGFFEPEEVF